MTTGHLTDGKIYLRALEPTDLDLLYRWENDSRLWKDGATIAPFSRKLLEDYVNNYEPDIFIARQLRLMVCLSEGDIAIGAVDLYDFDPRNSRCGVGLLIDEDFRGRGYATESLILTAEYCRRHLGLHQLYAVAGVNNQASRSSFESAGFRISGRLRSWIKDGVSYSDAYFMQLLLTRPTVSSATVE